jgi:CheY-like chemotaxis protein
MKANTDLRQDKIRLLLVDDNEPSRMVQTYVIESSFEDVAVVSSELVPPLNQMLGYDGIILDQRLIGENGLDIARHIQQENWRIPIMIMTALKPTDETFEKAYEVVDYVATKSDPPMFSNVLRAFIRQIRRISATAGEKGRDTPSGD